MVGGQLFGEHCRVCKGGLVGGSAAVAYGVRPDIRARLGAVQRGQLLFVDAVGTLVVGQHFRAAADGGRFQRMESSGRAAFGEDQHQFPAVGVGVGAHKGGVLFLVHHYIVDDEAEVLEHNGLPEAGHRAAAVDAVAHHPDDNAARPGDAQQGLADAFGVKVVALIIAQAVVGRGGHREVDAVGREIAQQGYAISFQYGVSLRQGVHGWSPTGCGLATVGARHCGPQPSAAPGGVAIAGASSNYEIAGPAPATASHRTRLRFTGLRFTGLR